MPESEDRTRGEGAEGGGGDPPERVGEALRRAVERTLGATAAPAAGTRQRAEELLDEVTKLGLAAREEVTKRGEAAREEVSRRGEAVREEVSRRGEGASARLAEAIAELRQADRAELVERIAAIEQRLSALEVAVAGREGRSNPQAEAEESPDKPHGQGKSAD